MRNLILDNYALVIAIAVAMQGIGLVLNSIALLIWILLLVR